MKRILSIAILVVVNVFIFVSSLSAQSPLIKANGEKGEAEFFDKRKNIVPSSFACITTDDNRKAYEVEIFTQSKTAYDAELKAVTSAPVKKGDVCLAKVTLRAVYARQETGECVAHFYFQRATSPWEKSIATQISASTEWKTIYIPFVAKNDFAASEAAVSIAFGSLRQKVQVAEIEVVNYHNTKQLADLPVTRLTYAGREADAKWRKDALARIDTLRKAPIKVTVVDANGKVVRGAKVNINQSRSAFVWGTAVNEAALAADDADAKQYKQMLKQFFNTATIENGLKAGGWAWTDDRKVNTLKAFKWLEDNDMQIRGHCLVWPGWKFNARAMREIAQQDTTAFHRYMLATLQERMAYAKGKVIAWDVINEMMHERDFYPYLPENWEVEVMKLARQLDPEAELFINDYAMLNGSHSPLVIEEYINLVKNLRSKGAPIDAVGVQGHVGTQPRSPIQILSDLDLFHKEGIPVQITEFDINTDDEELQADYTRDFLIAIYSHPTVEGMTLWGFMEKHHWKPMAAMFRKDWTERPAADEWRKLVCNEWRTNIAAATDRDGILASRGHLGEYDLTVTANGMTRNTKFTLRQEGADIIVQMVPEKPLFAAEYKYVGNIHTSLPLPTNGRGQGSGSLTLGCETLDRDYTNYDAYKTYLNELDIRNLRMQAGWAKTEKVKGVYDFSWLDHIVDDALSRGRRIWMQTSYGNPIYEGGGNANLGGGMPVSKEAKEAWNRWVRALAEHFRGRITDWELWNEPDLSGNIAAEDIVELNVRTAKILKSVDPNCRIAGFAFCVLNSELFTECMELTKKAGALDLFHWVSYHGYNYRPEDSYDGVEKFRNIINQYRPEIKLRQGENGAPSLGFKGGALDKYPWTELSQAKWDLRRLAGDHLHGVESSVFSIIDMAYPTGENKYVATLNVKGILQASPLKNAVRKKMVFSAVQNYAALFPLFATQQPAGTASVQGKDVITAAYRDADGKLSVVYWDAKKTPANSNNVSYRTMNINAELPEPHLIDILTGYVYTVPASNVKVADGKTTITRLPVYDSPMVVR